MPSNGLLNEERRREILAALHRDGRVLVKDLARHFRISQITIRKDLEFLDGQGSSSEPTAARCPCKPVPCSIQRCARKRSFTAGRRCRLPAPRSAWWKKGSPFCSIPARRRRLLPGP